MTNKHDAVNHPSHYTAGRFETIDVIEDIIQHYHNTVDAGLVWQTIKYLSRAPLKGNYKQDIEKAHFYLSRLVNRLSGMVEESEESPAVAHDGCVGCKYVSVPGRSEPCKNCRGTKDPCLRDYPDLYERMEDDRK